MGLGIGEGGARNYCTVENVVMSPCCSASEPRPWVHYKSQPNAKPPRNTRKSTIVKSLPKIVWFQQFSELDRISHGADVVGQSVPGGRTRMWERPIWLCYFCQTADCRNDVNSVSITWDSRYIDLRELMRFYAVIDNTNLHAHTYRLGQKLHTKLTAIILSSVNRSSEFFHWKIL